MQGALLIIGLDAAHIVGLTVHQGLDQGVALHSNTLSCRRGTLLVIQIDDFRVHVLNELHLRGLHHEHQILSQGILVGFTELASCVRHLSGIVLDGETVGSLLEVLMGAMHL